MILIAVMLAGAAGAAARFGVDRAIAQRVASAMPWGTWAVNLSGSAALGLLVGLSAEGVVALAVGTGFLGAYTTFWTWMYESLRLIEQGMWRVAAVNLIAPALAGPAAAALGMGLGMAVGS